MESDINIKLNGSAAKFETLAIGCPTPNLTQHNRQHKAAPLGLSSIIRIAMAKAPDQ